MWSKVFWMAVLERAIKTFAQVLATLLTSDVFGILDAPWIASLSVAGMATLVSMLMSIASGVVTDGGPSLNNSERLSARK